MSRAAYAIPILALVLCVVPALRQPPSEAALAGAHGFTWLADAPWIASLTLSALSIAAASFLFVRRGAWLAALLLALDPLAREAGQDAPSVALTVLAVAVAAAPRPTSRGLARAMPIVAVALIALAVLSRTQPVSLGEDPAMASFSAWPPFERWLALGHHAGWPLLFLAITGFALAPSRLVALALGGLTLIPSLRSGALVDFAALSPALAAAAATALVALARRDGAESPLRSPAAAIALGFTLAVQAPLLASDLASGLRFPLAAAAPALRVGEQALPPRVFTNLPHSVARLLHRGPATPLTNGALRDAADLGGVAIEKLPTGPRLEALLVPGGEERWIVVALVDGIALRASDDPPRDRAAGAARDDVIARLEAVRLPDLEARTPRFDLHRFELRVFRVPRAGR
jgi:hypothetical protein